MHRFPLQKPPISWPQEFSWKTGSPALWTADHKTSQQRLRVWKAEIEGWIREGNHHKRSHSLHPMNDFSFFFSSFLNLQANFRAALFIQYIDSGSQDTRRDVTLNGIVTAQFYSVFQLIVSLFVHSHCSHEPHLLLQLFSMGKKRKRNNTVSAY